MTHRTNTPMAKTFLHILGLVYSPEPDYEEIAADGRCADDKTAEAYKRNVRQYREQDLDHSSGACSARL